MGQIARLLVVLGFGALGWSVSAAPVARRRTRINILAAYFIVVHLVCAAAQREAWPFADHQALHGRAATNVAIWRLDFIGIDARGRSWVVDPLAWEPIYAFPLEGWVRYRLATLMPVQKRHDLLLFLLGKSEAARQRLEQGSRIGYDKYLAAAAARPWFIFPRTPRPSNGTLMRLRIELVEWTAADHLSGLPDHRYVIAEYPR